MAISIGPKNNMKFECDKAEVELNILSSYTTTTDKVAAAFGRAAEKPALKIFSDLTGVAVKKFNSQWLPEHFISVLGQKCKHDGLGFDPVSGEFIGPIEHKLITHGEKFNKTEVQLSNEELKIFNFCKEKELCYLLVLSIQLGYESMSCDYLGYLDLTQHPDVIIGKTITISKARPHLIV